MRKIVSQMKIKIIEKSTGKKKVEEWSFLPKDWKYQLTCWAHAKIFQNLAFFTFNTLGYSIDDLLILNLVTRQKFWMRRAIIASELIEKAGRLNLNYQINYRSTSHWNFHRFRTKNGRVNIAFNVEMYPVIIWMIF